MMDLTTLAPTQRGPVERSGVAGRSSAGGAGQSFGVGPFWPFEGGASQSWAGPGTDWFPFEGGAEQSWAGPGTDWFPFEGGAGQSWTHPGYFPYE